MLICSEEDLENLFLRHRDEHQRKRNCKRVRSHMLGFPRNTLFKATRHGIVVECADGSRLLISWKGNLLIFQSNGFRRVKQANARQQRRPRRQNTKTIARKITRPKRLRIRASSNTRRVQLFPQSGGNGMNLRTKFGSRTFDRTNRRPDDYEAGDQALRMWD